LKVPAFFCTLLLVFAQQTTANQVVIRWVEVCKQIFYQLVNTPIQRFYEIDCLLKNRSVVFI